MKISFISHASVIVITSDAVIWSDPWLHGNAFNESWTLLPEANFDSEWLNKITHIWISHEHPDHFHIPTLKSLSDDFKQRVVILFQANNSDKLPNALQKFGYKEIIRLPHAKSVQLTKETRIWCYQVSQMDSALAIQNNGQTVLNLNDAEVTARDCKIISKSFPNVDVVLNQFSIAGYNGHANYQTRLPEQANSILKKVLTAHDLFRSKITIPFASMIYFSTEDNQYINQYANTPRKLLNYFRENHKENEVLVLYPGETYTLNQNHDSNKSISQYDAIYQALASLPYSKPALISFDKLENSFKQLYARIHQRYYSFLLAIFLKPIKIHVPDLNINIVFDIVTGKFFQTDDKNYDLIIYSQPLNFALQFDWGFQTLGVSARCRVINNYNNYRRHRILFSLNNAEIWLKFKLFFNSRNIKWVASRFNGLIAQIKNRLASQL